MMAADNLFTVSMSASIYTVWNPSGISVATVDNAWISWLLEAWQELFQENIRSRRRKVNKLFADKAKSDRKEESRLIAPQLIDTRIEMKPLSGLGEPSHTSLSTIEQLPFHSDRLIILPCTIDSSGGRIWIFGGSFEGFQRVSSLCSWHAQYGRDLNSMLASSSRLEQVRMWDSVALLAG